ncbi:MAG: NAD+ synthase [Candidatus Brocadiia bacterium]|jgi:NAD+ synthetase
MKVALAQINPTVGDFSGNAAKILDAARRAAALGAELAVFPEMSIMGYPPRDLVEHAGFVAGGLDALDRLARELPLPAVVGFVARNETGEGKPLHNSAALIRDGRVVSVHHKSLLPTYDVFDEDRYFEPGRQPHVAPFGGRALGITICEDCWRIESSLRARYHFDPVPVLLREGAQVILNLSASPFTLGKQEVRRKLLADQARRLKLPIVYVNQVGGNDELVFDGGSMVVNARGELVALAKQFEEDLLVVDLDALPAAIAMPPEQPAEAAFRALALGTRDYLHKCGFRSAVLGLSGGIDSALTAVIAAEALGAQNVLGVSMPSRFSSAGSRDDAKALADNLGIRYQTIPIEQVHQAFLDTLAPAFAGRQPDITEENVQARIRGTILMALSNKFGSMLLTTGNKSELATGYCTLYGDMCGGLAPIGDVPKMMVYEISRWVNREKVIIPLDSLTKPPSAELRPNQTDQDTLPPYELVDRVLRAYVEEQKDPREVIASGVDRAVVEDVVRRIETSEYKRRQAVPVLKITSKAFGYGRQVPIAKRTPRA